MAEFIDESVVAVTSAFIFCIINLTWMITCTRKKPLPSEPSTFADQAASQIPSTTPPIDPLLIAPPSGTAQQQEYSDSTKSSRAAPLVDSGRSSKKVQRTKVSPSKQTDLTVRPTFTKDLDIERCLPEDSALIDRPPSKDRFTAESVTDEICVPIGKTATSPAPQSSLTNSKNLKDIGKPRLESSVKFGEERVSTTRSQPAAAE